MKLKLTGIAAVFVIGLLAGMVTRPARSTAHLGREQTKVREIIHTTKEQRSASMIGGESGIDLSQGFSDYHRIDKGRALIASAEDFQAGEFADLFEGNRHDNTVGRMIAKRWAEIDPETFHAYLIENPDGDGWPLDSWEVLFRTWGASDPDAAFGAMIKNQYDYRQQGALRHLTDTILHHDPDKALALIAGSPGFPVTQMRDDWIRKNPGGIAGKLKSIPDSRFRTEAMKSALKIWFGKSPDATIAFASTLEGSLALTVRPFITDWARTDPEAAVAFAVEKIPMDASNDVALQAVGVWAEQDAGSAWDWAMENLWGAARGEARSRILRGAAADDPVVAVELINTLPEHRRARALSEFTKSFAKTDRDAALEWAHSEADPEFRTRIFSTIGNDWANGNFREMAKYIRENAESVPRAFVSPLAARWGRIYPKEAIGWQMHLPDEHGIPAAEIIMRNWAQTTPNAAGEWVFKMGHPEKRSRAFAAVAREYLRKDPKGAAAWLEEAAALPEKVSAEQIRNAVINAGLPSDRRDEVLALLGIAGGTNR